MGRGGQLRLRPTPRVYCPRVGACRRSPAPGKSSSSSSSFKGVPGEPDCGLLYRLGSSGFEGSRQCGYGCVPHLEYTAPAWVPVGVRRLRASPPHPHPQNGACHYSLHLPTGELGLCPPSGAGPARPDGWAPIRSASAEKEKAKRGPFLGQGYGSPLPPRRGLRRGRGAPFGNFFFWN